MSIVNRILAAYKVLGIIFLVLLIGAVYLTYAIFDKKFVDYDRVSLETSSIGLQLPARADVKIRGVIVGEVLDTETTADGATVTLGLFPDEVSTIDKDVTGSIVPKTLFGEKYVSLIAPGGTVDPIQAGDVIEKTQLATEVEEVLSDLNPLLRTVQPAQLNMTLNAVATALEGRGDELGDNLERIDAYLKKLNPEIPRLLDDLRLTARTSDIYTDVLPQVADILDDTVLTTTTLEGREARLSALFTDVAALSDSARTFLDDNEDSIVRLGDVSVPSLRLLARYSPEFPCLLGGLVNIGKRAAEAFRGFELHIVLETLPRQPRRYDAGDQPRLGEDRGPTCINLPTPPGSQDNPLTRVPNFNDGVDRPTGKGTSRVAPGYALRDLVAPGVPAETELLRQITSGQSADAAGYDSATASSDDLGPLLAAPMLRGAEVSTK